LFRRYIHDKLQPNQPREVNMGLHHTAHYLKSKGRGNDTMLVHMTPNEVKGLQALAMAKGGSLTTNPQTGLPEAGFLEDILPVVAAAGLTYLTAGAATPVLAGALGPTMGGIAAGALSGAAISGLTAAVTGKDAGQAALMGGLGGGIAGGLGAYADAPNLLADVTQKTAETAGTEAGRQMTEELAKQATTSNLNTATGIVQSGMPTPTPDVSNVYSGLAGQPTVPPGTMPPVAPINPGFTPVRPDAAAQGITGVGPDLTTGTVASSAPPVSPSSTSNALRTINAQPSFYQDQGTLGRMASQGLPAYGLIGDAAQTQTGPENNYVSPLRRISPNFQGQEPIRPNPYYRAQYPVYAAEGGIMKLQGGGGPVERMTQMNTAMNPQGGLYPQGMIDKTQYATPTQRPASLEMLDTEPSYQKSNPLVTAAGMNTGGVARALPKGDAGVYKDTDPTTRSQDAFTAAMTRLGSMQKKANIKGLPVLKAAAKPLGNVEEAASGGVMSSIGGYSDGGRMLKGPGDGMSDSIPGVIGGKQPARLADGEFVVPADVVSHLGNGSTDAGARKLYKMMDKIRKARTGRKKQAPAVKADKYLPA
jgi:hypothetical protein